VGGVPPCFDKKFLELAENKLKRLKRTAKNCKKAQKRVPVWNSWSGCEAD
jgi:hypothetical protein